MHQRRSFLKRFFTFIFCLLLIGFFSGMAHARSEYALKTGRGCIFCHQQELGGPLKVAGIAYIKNGYRYPIPNSLLEKADIQQKSFHRILRLIAGYVHMVAAFIFIGAIFYIHIFIKPTKITGGIPRGERLLGVSCMIIITVTGIYLTWFQIDRWAHFFNNLFGLMLFIKIVLFCLMVITALFAITVVHRKMKKEAQEQNASAADKKITRANLNHFDGTNDKPSCIVFENTLYDVSESDKWSDGNHFRKHKAGNDLTEELKGAPHGPEVFQNIKRLGRLEEESGPHHQLTPTGKRFVIMAYSNMVYVFLIILCISIWRWGFPLSGPYKNKETALSAQSCIDCHEKLQPGILNDWRKSVHAKVGVDCIKCHQLESTSSERAFMAHLNHTLVPISMVVSPKTCESCHPKEVKEYTSSKHANTIDIISKIDKWMTDGMNNGIERTTGCFNCHGTVIDLINGKPAPGTWPNVGVGRKNPDGSLGSCTSCHTRHKFSVAEARKPEACDQCHLGPDHPQIEIYNESKHGTIYHAEENTWNWTPEDGKWLAGRDYRAPTCAGCHMSQVRSQVEKTHDVTQRLSWELQAPLTIRPNAFTPFPADTDWEKERHKMGLVCMQCHSETWRNDHFENLDKVVSHYNDTYYKPAKHRMDELYEKGLLSKDIYFDENPEWEFYALWHYEGRRARMGTAMMAPDYAWWHGFYELKHRLVHFMEETDALIANDQKAHVYSDFPGKIEKEK